MGLKLNMEIYGSEIKYGSLPTQIILWDLHFSQLVPGSFFGL